MLRVLELFAGIGAFSKALERLNIPHEIVDAVEIDKYAITSVQKDNYLAIKTANTQGYDYATDGDGIDLGYPNSTTRRGRVGHGVSKTIPTGGR